MDSMEETGAVDMARADHVTHEEETEIEEWESPEGGWGWMVAFGLALVLIVSLGPMMCFGLIFGNFLEGLGEGSSGVTIINSVYMTLHSFSGLLTNYVLKSYSCRQVAVFGSLLFFLGNLLTAFATNIYHMIITFGVLPGVGLGLMIPASFHCFNDYFVRRRVFVMGVAQTVLSAGIMLYPIIVQHLVEHYGFRGAQAIVAAMTLNATLGALAFIPAGRKPARRRAPMLIPRGLSVGSKESISRMSRFSSEDSSLAGAGDTWQQKEAVKLIHTLATTYEEDGPAKSSDESEGEGKMQRKTNGSVVAHWTHDEKPKADQQQTHLLIIEDGWKEADGSAAENGAPPAPPSTGRPHRVPRPSVISIGSLVVSGAGSMALQGDSRSMGAGRRRGDSRNCWYAVVDFLDLSLLKDPVYANLALGVSFAYYSDFTFVTLFPLFMFSLGFSLSDTALCIALGAASDLAGRVVFSLLGACCSIRARSIFLAGATCMVLGRAVMIYVNSFLALAIANGFHGFFRAWIHVNFSLVFAEHCSRDRFPSAYGLFMAISGVVGISTGPLIGVIRDMTDSYAICIHSLNIQMLLCVVPWTLELVYRRCVSPP